MFALIRSSITLLHWALNLIRGTLRLLISIVVFNPHLGPLRYITNTILGFVLFALFLVYIFAPLRGWAGSYWMGPKIHYASERWLGTALYNNKNHFIGTFDPNMDSKRDLNTSSKPILIDNPSSSSVSTTTCLFAWLLDRSLLSKPTPKTCSFKPSRSIKIVPFVFFSNKS